MLTPFESACLCECLCVWPRDGKMLFVETVYVWDRINLEVVLRARCLDACLPVDRSCQRGGTATVQDAVTTPYSRVDKDEGRVWRRAGSVSQVLSICKDLDMITEESGLERGYVGDEDINFFFCRIFGTEYLAHLSLVWHVLKSNHWGTRNSFTYFQLQCYKKYLSVQSLGTFKKTKANVSFMRPWWVISLWPFAQIKHKKKNSKDSQLLTVVAMVDDMEVC